MCWNSDDHSKYTSHEHYWINVRSGDGEPLFRFPFWFLFFGFGLWWMPYALPTALIALGVMLLLGVRFDFGRSKRKHDTENDWV